MDIVQIIEQLTQLQIKNNEDALEFNELLEERDSLSTAYALVKLELNASQEAHKKALSDMEEAEDTFMAQALKVSKQAEIERHLAKISNAELKQLRLLDPHRLAKVNKEQKRKLIDLKEKNTYLEKQRKEAVALYTRAKKLALQVGNAAFYEDPKTGNTLSLSGFIVDKDNKRNLLGGSPIVVYNHSNKGISRQGMLTDEGQLVWASAQNTAPTATETNVALQTIRDYCKKLKIKVPKFEES